MRTPRHAATLSIAITLLSVALPGCAALSPVDGYAPEELSQCLTRPTNTRDADRTIDLSRLGQRRPSEHLVGPGDTLGVYVEGVLGEEEKPPVVIAPATDRQQPRTGTPIVVSRAGLIRLPSVEGAIPVAGHTIPAVQRLVREAYEDPETGVLQPGQGRIIVQLLAPRTTRVVVIRRDQVDPAVQPPQTPGSERGYQPPRGSSQLVELKAFENDVLHALVASGGLPGPEAENAVYIMRASRETAVAIQPTPASRPRRDGGPRRLPEPKLDPGLPAVDSDQAGDGPVMPVGFSFADMRNRFGSCQTAGCDVGSFDVCDRVPCIDGCDAGDIFDAVHGATDAPTFSPRPVRASIGGHSVGGHAMRTPASRPQPTRAMSGHSMLHAPQIADVFLRDDADSLKLAQALFESPHVTRIPLSTPCGCPQAFSSSDVILHDGDVVFIEAREREFFYTAGLFGGGKYTIPRGETLDVLDAIALVDAQRRQLPGKYVGGVSSVSQDVTVGASRLVIYRRVRGGKTVPIKLNLNQVKRDPATAIAVRPGDRLFLQYTPWEMIAASFERHFLEGSVLGLSSAAAFGD